MKIDGDIEPVSEKKRRKIPFFYGKVSVRGTFDVLKKCVLTPRMLKVWVSLPEPNKFIFFAKERPRKIYISSELENPPGVYLPLPKTTRKTNQKKKKN